MFPDEVLDAFYFHGLAEVVVHAGGEATLTVAGNGVGGESKDARLAGGRADSRILQEFMGKMARRDYSLTGNIANMLKDLEGVQALARATQTATPVTAIVTEINRAFVASGQGAEDTCVLMRQLSDHDSPCSSTSRRINSGIATAGCVSFNCMAMESGSDAKARPSLKCVARMSCKLALTKKYCCLRRSSLP